MSIEKNKHKAQALAKDQRRHKWKCEMLFKRMLNRELIMHVHQKPFWSDAWFYSGDFYVPKLKLLIELDGSNHRKRKEHDKTRSHRLLKSGKVKEILRIKNSDLTLRPRFVYKKVIEIRNRIWDDTSKDN